jgi:hypothetical protein
MDEVIRIMGWSLSIAAAASQTRNRRAFLDELFARTERFQTMAKALVESGIDVTDSERGTMTRVVK